MVKPLLLYIVVFLSSFLLFQVELIIAKFYLPFFGGNYLVWGSCVVFFQAVLLLAYLHSHYVINKIGIKRYQLFHLFLLVIPFFFFPGKNLLTPQVYPSIPFVFNIFLELLLSVGPVFFVLSTMSIIYQGWIISSDLKKTINPYVLFAVSNFGSFLGLLSYPFFFEMYLPIDIQQSVWRVLYIATVLLNIQAFLTIKIDEKKAVAIDEPQENISNRLKIKWTLLSFVGVLIFLSVTNIVSSEIAPIPLFWVIPLSLYLLSFTLCFKQKPLCPSWVTAHIGPVLGLAMIIYFLSFHNRYFPFIVMAGFYLIVQFWVCMYCQKELYEARPKNNEKLTLFYVFIGLGGFLGGVFSTWAAPFLYNSTQEYLLSIVLVAVVLFLERKERGFAPEYLRYMIYFLIMMLFWPQLFPIYNLGGFIYVFLITCAIFSLLNRNKTALLIFCAIIFSCSVLLETVWTKILYIEKFRNYYGTYEILQQYSFKMLKHSGTVHGGQFVDEKRNSWATTYYSPLTPVGHIFSQTNVDFNRIGLIGLGAGTLASYGKEGDMIDFYDIDPDVKRIAQEHFTYLKNSKAKYNIIIGDARISLKEIKDGTYDVLVVDAYSGDAVPVHLLSIEAINEFKRVLKKEGILLFHVSNRYLSINNVIIENCLYLKGVVVSAANPAHFATGTYGSEWVVVSWDKENLKKVVKEDKKYWIPLGYADNRKRAVWTDQYSSLLSIVRWAQMRYELKSFNFLR